MSHTGMMLGQTLSCEDGCFSWPHDCESTHLGDSNITLTSIRIASSFYIQSLFWRVNKLDRLKNIKELHGDLEPRYDPTVIPHNAVPHSSRRELPEPRERKDGTQYYTCKDYHNAYKHGDITPLAVAEALLPLIERPSGKHSSAFVDSRRDMVLKAAQSSTDRYQDGRDLGMLDGVPISVKDEVDLTGHKRMLGSHLDRTNPLDQTAWCVTRWQVAGAVILGKTNMHEFGLDTTNNNPNTGTPLNPHDPNYYCGGSSGGSAYSVATGLCPISLGVDGGGSIRLPASYCGVYGLKPSHGRVSARPTQNAGVSVAVNGPIASSIDDLALGYRVMAQPDPENRFSAMFPDPMSEAESFSQPPKVIGMCSDWIARSDPEVRRLFEAAVSYLENCGYETCNIEIPFLPEAQKSHALTVMSEVRSGLSQTEIAKSTRGTQLLMHVTGSHATGQDFLFAQRMRDLLMKHLAYLWQQHPGMIILTPATPCAGTKIGNAKDVEIGGYGVLDSDQTWESRCRCMLQS